MSRARLTELHLQDIPLGKAIVLKCSHFLFLLGHKVMIVHVLPLERPTIARNIIQRWFLKKHLRIIS